MVRPSPYPHSQRCGCLACRKVHKQRKVGYERGVRLWVPPTATVRRLRHLAWMGHSTILLGERLGMRASAVSRLMAGNGAVVHVETEAAVERVYLDLWNVEGISPWSKAMARRKGWAPAGAYDDLANPREKPKGLVQA